MVAKNAAWGPPNPIGTPNLKEKEGKEKKIGREEEKKRRREEEKRRREG